MTVPEPATIPVSFSAPVLSSGEITTHAYTPQNELEWDTYVLGRADGSPFHQAAWKRAIEKTFGFRPLYVFAKRNDRITGIAPVFLISNWMTGRCLISNPFAVYGGILADDQETESRLIAELQGLGQEQRVQYLELRSRRSQSRPNFHRNSRYSTFTLPLCGDAIATYNALPKDIRYMIRKAEKAGLRVRHGLEQFSSFYHLMTINLRRLGTPAFPQRWFKNLLEEFRGQVTLTVVYEGGTALAAGLSFLFRDWMQPYYIGSLDAAKKVGANNFLWWELIKLATERGCTRFDFGRSKNESGNFDFKKKWNPTIEPLEYQVRLFQRKDVPNFSPANPKFQMATDLWKQMPLSLTRIVGPRVIRWFP
ncbi:MAG TPA: FemAB family XrtA/PEP-CTERM system-associated protein [Dongiaceae bacterium]|nr:FemAB family XrtA/PEP-CTERM system-associated protein [Dongiaceae bacterium]